MSESVFESFIDSVYSGGSALSVFDTYVGGLEVVGGADDITVSSIFGGVDLSADNVDDNIDEGVETIVSNLNVPIGGAHKDEPKEDIMETIDDYETMFEIGMKGGEVKEDEPIVDNVNYSIQTNASDPIETKKSDGLTASDVSSMLRMYR
jgi:hypothetical protein